MLGFLLVAVATPKMEENGDWSGKLLMSRFAGGQMTLIIDIFPRLSCSFVLLLPSSSKPHGIPFVCPSTGCLGSFSYRFASRKLRT